MIVGTLAGCASAPWPPAGRAPDSRARAPAADSALGPVLLQARSRWTPVAWSELPGLQEDPLHEAWNAWLKSCERPGPVFAPLCSEVRLLSISSVQEQRAWMMARLQPYRVEGLQGGEDGLLTGYYEPVLEAARQPSAEFSVPLYQPPPTLGQRKPWYSRQEIDHAVKVAAAAHHLGRIPLEPALARSDKGAEASQHGEQCCPADMQAFFGHYRRQCSDKRYQNKSIALHDAHRAWLQAHHVLQVEAEGQQSDTDRTDGREDTTGMGIKPSEQNHFHSLKTHGG